MTTMISFSFEQFRVFPSGLIDSASGSRCRACRWLRPFLVTAPAPPPAVFRDGTALRAALHQSPPPFPPTIPRTSSFPDAVNNGRQLSLVSAFTGRRSSVTSGETGSVSSVASTSRPHNAIASPHPRTCAAALHVAPRDRSARGGKCLKTRLVRVSFVGK